MPKNSVRSCLVLKNGITNISKIHVSKRRRQYLIDFYTTLVDIQWRWNLLIFVFCFVIIWMIAAVLWWLISLIHGDFDPNKSSNFTPCIENIEAFAGVYLFSFETFLTIGYGFRYITEQCSVSIIVLCFQLCLGVLLSSFVVGVFFAKIIRPKQRAASLLFTKKAVICKRDGKLCLLFRIGDWRKSRVINAHIRVQLFKSKMTEEGEIILFHPSDVKVDQNSGSDKILLNWPCTVCHEINEKSPFWKLSAIDLYKEKFELIIILEGVSGSSSTTQSRTSYLPEEILWGYRFKELVTYEKNDGRYVIDFSSFDETIQVDTPSCSAYQLATIDQSLNQLSGYFSINSSDDEGKENEEPENINKHLASSSTSKNSIISSNLVHPFSYPESANDNLSENNKGLEY